MLLPRGDEYYAAIQDPGNAFSDPQLRSGRAELNVLGLPKPYSGGFTTTYHLVSGASEWAVRCFTRDVPELQRRYRALGSFMAGPPNGVLVPADCLSRGILVNGQWHPVIKMQWVRGDTLNAHVERNIGNRPALSRLAQTFLQLVRYLQQRGIAHGDLQHGNIIVRGTDLVLIDYDGVYLPELAGMQANELGHVNYQHPARDASHFNAGIDRFSAIVIHLALTAVSVRPELWRKYDNGENLLLRSDDFADPDSSPLIADLRGTPGLGELANRFAGACRLDLDSLPTLDRFISGSFQYSHAPSAAVSAVVQRSQYPIIDATKLASLLEHVGQRVEVVGLACQTRRLITRRRQPSVFLNFGAAYPHHTFSLVVWAEVLRADWGRLAGVNAIEDQWLSITGVIGTYRGRPQIILDSPSQVRLLSGRAEAQALISGRPAPSPSAQERQSRSRRQSRQAAGDEEAAILDRLYAGRPAASERAAQAGHRQPTTTGLGRGAPPAKATRTTPKKAAAPQSRDSCFVATATYGTPYAGEVQVLCAYRDEVMQQTNLGRCCIRLYTVVGPPLAWMVRRVPGAKGLCAVALGRLAGRLRRSKVAP